MLNLDSERLVTVSKLSLHGPKDNLPRFSISTDCDVMPEDHKELSPVEETDAKVSPQEIQPPATGRIIIPPASSMIKQNTRSVIKSASVSGLSLIIPSGMILTFLYLFYCFFHSFCSMLFNCFSLISLEISD